MKKMLIVLAISAIGFIACNNSAENKEGGDSVATAPVTEDSLSAVNPSDTIVNLDTMSAPVPNDSTTVHP